MDSVAGEALRSLRDIKGIHGSFIVREGSGELLCRDLPAVVDDNVLMDVGPRIDRLLGIVESAQPTETVAMRFGEERLDIKRMGSAHLCVLADAGVSPPALRMAMKLVCRKLEAHAWPAPALDPKSSAPASSAGQKITVQFRGRTTRI